MQSLGRYRGAVKTVEEARKLVPTPGDANKTIAAKIQSIEDFTRDTDEELTKLTKRHRERLMPATPVRETAPTDAAAQARAAELSKQGKPFAVTGPQPPFTNAKGWTLHVDKDGNRAYVNPDKTQYEELK
jgi:hypothetical protein